MEFKNVLKELRTKKGLSQAELAEKLGFSTGLIGMYESGKRKPSDEALEALADFFNISIDYLMGKDDKSVYYLDPDTAELAQEIYDDKNKQMLFSATRDISKEDMQFVIDMVERLTRNSNG